MLSIRSSRLFSAAWTRLSEKLVLVLDDYQEITNRVCHDSLSFFLERAPSNVTVALSTRSDPPIPMGRLRALEELLELRAVDLSFTEDESATFLNEILHLGLATETLGVLHRRTEGWPVGVRLAAMSLSQAADPAGFVARFDGASRHIVDYLTEVVLDTLDEDQRRFLLETSVLDAMCGPLCDAATGRQGSAEVLVELERANLFLIPLDDRREWYRYHELFGDVLRYRLLQSDSELVRTVHRRASEWLGPEGHRYEAVRHAVAANALESAITLVLEDWRPSLEQDEAAAILRQLEELPWTSVERDARLAVVRAWALSALNRREDSLTALESAESARCEQAMPCGLPFEAATALTRACFPWGDVGRMLGAAGTGIRAAGRHVLDRKTGLPPRARLGTTSSRASARRPSRRSSRLPSSPHVRTNGSSPASPRRCSRGSRSRLTTSTSPCQRPGVR